MGDDAATVEQLRAELAASREREAALVADAERRDRALTEALEQQTATADILRVIASSPTDAQPVLDAVAHSAVHLSGSAGGTLSIREGEFAQVVSTAGVISTAGGSGRYPIGTRLDLSDVHPGLIAMLEGRTVHIPDRSSPEFRTRFPTATSGPFASLHVPLIAQTGCIGTISVSRDVTGPYSPREIALLETFADQAVIAIENARLFEELRHRTAELAELNQTLEARVSEQVEQLERVGRLRRYLSPQLAELIVSSGDESILASHRRRITVVFCDLRGFTAFAETEEPEEVMGVLGEYHAAMGDLIRTYEGTFGHFAGDGLMTFFNDPLPQPDHVERAVRLACAMRERAVELALGWRRAGYELDFGVGIAVGYATLGRIGFEGRYDYDVIGTVANLAARLCAEAAGGQILIPARLHGMVESLVEAEPVGELTLKGLHRPVEAFNITGLREDQSLPLDQATGHAASDA